VWKTSLSLFAFQVGGNWIQLIRYRVLGGFTSVTSSMWLIR